MGICRTYVFVSGEGEPAILDAVRAHRTVVFGLDGKAYGDSVLVNLAKTDGRLPRTTAPRSPWLRIVSQLCGVLGLAGVMFLRR